MYRLFLAIRYLLTRPINLLSMFGVMLSVWALIVVVSIFSGFLKVVEEHVHAANADISVSYLPEWARWSKLLPALQDDPNVAGAAPRLLHYGLLHRPGERPPEPPLPGRGALHGGDQPFLFVLGVDPAAEAKVTGFADWLRSPEIPPELRVAAPDQPLAERDGLPTVLVGADRMAREHWRPGDHLVLTTGRLRAERTGHKGLQQFSIELVVAGAFKTAHSGFDGNNVFVAIGTLREALFDGAAEVVQEVAVHLRDGGDDAAAATTDRLQRAVARAVDNGSGRAFGMVQTWREKNANFFHSIEHQRSLLKIVLVVIMIVVAFLMLATLSMMVTEKISDIGILTAMGGTPGGVTMVFLACGLTITIAGIVLGFGAGALTSIYLEEIRQAVKWLTGVDLFPIDVYNLERVPFDLDPLWLLEVAGLTLVVGFVVSSLPAWRAARHDPLVSLRAN